MIRSETRKAHELVEVNVMMIYQLSSKHKWSFAAVHQTRSTYHTKAICNIVRTSNELQRHSIHSNTMTHYFVLFHQNQLPQFSHFSCSLCKFLTLIQLRLPGALVAVRDSWHHSIRHLRIGGDSRGLICGHGFHQCLFNVDSVLLLDCIFGFLGNFLRFVFVSESTSVAKAARSRGAEVIAQLGLLCRKPPSYQKYHDTCHNHIGVPSFSREKWTC